MERLQKIEHNKIVRCTVDEDGKFRLRSLTQGGALIGWVVDCNRSHEVRFLADSKETAQAYFSARVQEQREQESKAKALYNLRSHECARAGRDGSFYRFTATADAASCLPPPPPPPRPPLQQRHARGSLDVLNNKACSTADQLPAAQAAYAMAKFTVESTESCKRQPPIPCRPVAPHTGIRQPVGPAATSSGRGYTPHRAFLASKAIQLVQSARTTGSHTAAAAAAAAAVRRGAPVLPPPALTVAPPKLPPMPQQPVQMPAARQAASQQTTSGTSKGSSFSMVRPWTFDFSGCEVRLRDGAAVPGMTADYKPQLGTKVAAGGFGSVYTVQGREDLLIKVFCSEHGKINTNSAQTELQTFGMLRRSGVQGVLQIFGAGSLLQGACSCPMATAIMQMQQILVMVMPKMKTSLDKLLEAGGLPPYRILGYAGSVLRVLHTLQHGQDGNVILHRDLKPANMLLDDNGNLLVSDFGGAGIFNAAKGSSKRSAAVMCESVAGTGAYMCGDILAAYALGISKAVPYDAILADYHALAISIIHMLVGPYDNLHALVLDSATCDDDVVQHIKQLLANITSGQLLIGAITANNRDEYQPVLDLIRGLVEHESSQHVDSDLLLQFVEDRTRRYKVANCSGSSDCLW